MHVGVKIYEPPAVEFLKEFRDSVDFLEVMAVLGNDYSYIKDFGLPVVIHNEHFAWGVNFANPKRVDLNRSSLDFSLSLADKLDARYVIVHPERVEEEYCSESQVVGFLSEYPDKRIIIESMPYYGEGCYFYAYDHDSIKRLLGSTGKRMCLDFAHSSEAAVSLGKEPLSFIRELLSLKPVHFHLSDTRLETLKDMHMHLLDGNLPLQEYKKLLPREAWVTLETSHAFDKTKDDINFLKD
jgi:sugar phosphate isomerase/epimerase